MTDLLDSLRELARDDGSITAASAYLDQTVRRAIDAVVTRPELRTRNISIATSGDMEGVFDSKKIERAFFNLILNACEATAQSQGQIQIGIHATAGSFAIRVTDNGTGIPASIRRTLFDPFISSGKSSGTGLGLAIVNKIVRDHDGSVTVETDFWFRNCIPCEISPLFPHGRINRAHRSARTLKSESKNGESATFSSDAGMRTASRGVPTRVIQERKFVEPWQCRFRVVHDSPGMRP